MNAVPEHVEAGGLLTTPTPTQSERARILNPKSSQLMGTDAHLPAIAASNLHHDFIEQALKQAGSIEPATRGDGRQFEGRTIRAAAVLVGLVDREPDGAGVSVVFTQRAAAMRNHAGQIALPGGAIDLTDTSPWAAAQREAFEEIALDPSLLSPLGALLVYTTVTAFEVTPCVGWIQPQAQFTPAPDEVAAVFEVPLAFLMNPANHQRRSIQTPVGERSFYAMPYTDAAGQERFIWGATAGMLRNFYKVFAAHQSKIGAAVNS